MSKSPSPSGRYDGVNGTGGLSSADRLALVQAQRRSRASAAPWQSVVFRPLRISELDVASAPLADAILRNAGADTELLVLDLSALYFMDCAGLRVLLEADARQRDRGGRLVLLHCSERVRRLLDITGASGRLEMPLETDDPSAKPPEDNYLPRTVPLRGSDD